MIKNLKILYKDVLKISKLSNVGNKKLRIFVSIVLSNVTVGFDLLIIVVFSRILGEEITSDNQIVAYVLDNLFLLPIIIVLRFISIYVEKTNTLKKDGQINLAKSDIESLYTIEEERIIWSKKLKELARVIPDDIETA